MLTRCYNPGVTSWKYYGARGIEVCREWRLSFDAFLKHVGPRLTDRHSIERIDNDGNYEPGNVRWATRHEQLRNTRQNRWLVIDGVKKCLEDWAKESPVSKWTIFYRLQRGWPPKKAVFTKLKVERRLVTFRGKTMSWSEWAAHLGVTKRCLVGRFENGWSLDQILKKEGRPVRRSLVTFEGLSLTVSEWAKRLGVSAGTISARKSRGLPIHKMLAAENLKTIDTAGLKQGALTTRLQKDPAAPGEPILEKTS